LGTGGVGANGERKWKSKNRAKISAKNNKNNVSAAIMKVSGMKYQRQ